MAPHTLAAGLPLLPPLSLVHGLAKPCPRENLHHQHHHNCRGAEIYLATPSLLAGSRRRSLHRAVRVDTAEVLLLRRFIGLDRVDITSPRDYMSLVAWIDRPTPTSTKGFVRSSRVRDWILSSLPSSNRSRSLGFLPLVT